MLKHVVSLNTIYNMKFGVVNKLRAVYGAVAIGLGVLTMPTSSFAQAADCKNVGKLAYKMAETRDGGTPYKNVYASFVQMRKAGKIDQNDFDQATLFLKYVYTDGMYESPARIQRQITAFCDAYR